MTPEQKKTLDRFKEGLRFSDQVILAHGRLRLNLDPAEILAALDAQEAMIVELRESLDRHILHLRALGGDPPF